ncbi:DUF4012 domain-containing protein [Aquihabitans daechungensis]|uniref:DUF4012 domain-containing protein n=1 Tax=Aquihabitans daechungensis TaxID=1052257 RepID=UPI003BA1E932
MGRAGLGIMVNAVFWYPPSAAPWGAALAIGAMALVVVAGYPHMRSSRRRAAAGILIGAAALVLLAGIAAVVAVGLSYRQVRSGAENAQSALDSARNGDAAAAGASLDAARSSFEAASDRLSGPLAIPAEFVPGLAQQVTAVRTTVDQGRTITAAADDLVATADYDRLQYDRRLDLQQVQDLAGPAARADVVLGEARRELAEVEDSWLLPPLRDRIDLFTADIDEARVDTALAADILEHTPGLFGADGSRRYLVVFLTPAELPRCRRVHRQLRRARDRGRQGDAHALGPHRRPHRGAEPRGAHGLGPEDYLARYGRFDPARFPQDVTYSPHFPSDASVIAELYPQAGGAPVDGVIAIDPKGSLPCCSSPDRSWSTACPNRSAPTTRSRSSPARSTSSSVTARLAAKSSPAPPRPRSRR